MFSQIQCPTPPKRKNWPPTLIEWLVIGTFVALLIALLLPSPQTAITSASRDNCRTNLKVIGLALHNYHDKYGSFPPAYMIDADGRPNVSWRVLLLPFLDHEDIYHEYRFDERWDSPHNRQLADRVNGIFNCPTSIRKKGPEAAWMTSYVAVIGPETLWQGRQPVTISDITDGLSNTLMVVEVANSQIHWMEPRDLRLSEIDLSINNPDRLGISSHHVQGTEVLFADGRVWFLVETLPKTTMRALLTRAGQEVVDEY